MSTALATIAAVPAVTSEQLDLVRKTVAKDATPDELKLYLYDCARQGVHPLDKLIHFTKRQGKYTPITSIDFMRTRAGDTGDYAGSDDAVFVGEAMKPEWASTVTVWRLVQGQRCAFTSTARWSEYKPDANDFMWKKMPHTMLAKCAEALALRKGFPRQLAGLYAAEEMDQALGGSASRAPNASGSSREPSVPNGGEIGTPFIDTTTGEERPAPPKGYFYVADYSLRNGWHEFHVLNYDAQGGSLRLSTKKKCGELAERAAVEGIPVAFSSTPKKNGAPGEAYLDALSLWRPEMATPEPVAEMLTEDQIPF